MQSRSENTRFSKAGDFPVTRWTMIVRAQEGSDADLETLLGRYWYPLYAFARRSGRSFADAEDLTQSFVTKLLGKGWIAEADPSRGKMRTFLLSRFKRFMTDEWRKESAMKRGGEATAWRVTAGNVKAVEDYRSPRRFARRNAL